MINSISNGLVVHAEFSPIIMPGLLALRKEWRKIEVQHFSLDIEKILISNHCEPNRKL